MDHAVATVRPGWRATFSVPPSKSVHQRALVLAALGAGPLALEFADPARRPGEDVARCAAMLAALGPWAGASLGASRTSLTLDAGEGATAFRFALALAPLRPRGARTLVRGRPVLLRRPHGPLLRALTALGARIKRRSSGAVRILGGGLRPGQRLLLDVRQSSQFASALLLIAPRIGGLTLDLRGGATSRAYLDLTISLLRRFNVPVDVDGDTVHVPGAAPRAAALRVESDASAAAAWWTAAALTRGEGGVTGLPRDSTQPDMALLGILEAMGAEVTLAEDGTVVVRGPLAGLRATPYAHDLRRTPDLLFLVGVLGAQAEGETVITGVGHARGKESDRVAVLVAGLRALGVEVHVDASDTLRIRGGGASLDRRAGARVSVGGDHRAAFAFGVLGLARPGMILAGAEVAAKSQPGFLQDLAGLAREGLDTASGRYHAG